MSAPLLTGCSRRGGATAGHVRKRGAFLVDEWLPARRAAIRTTTWDHYRRIVEAYVVPTIGTRPLSDLSPAHLNALYADLLRGDRRQLKSGAEPGGPDRATEAGDAEDGGNPFEDPAAAAETARREGARDDARL